MTPIILTKIILASFTSKSLFDNIFKYFCCIAYVIKVKVTKLHTVLLITGIIYILLCFRHTCSLKSEKRKIISNNNTYCNNLCLKKKNY